MSKASGGAFAQRVSVLNSAALRPHGAYVLYWMTAARRPFDNWALQRAVHWANELGKPLLVLEALRCDYPWASDRLHRFVLEGMADHARYFAQRCSYYPYVEPSSGAGSGLLEQLAQQAAVVIGDHSPAFFLPRMQRAAAERVPVLFEVVDGNGVLPLRLFERAFQRAASFRRAWHRAFVAHDAPSPEREPLRARRLQPAPVPAAIRARFPAATLAQLERADVLCGALRIDHDVEPAQARGGYLAAEAQLASFLRERLVRYGERGDPLSTAESGLGPYLHFGHVAATRVFEEVTRCQHWTRDGIQPKNAGEREGFWGMTAPTEGFLDELITWRELSYNLAERVEDYQSYDAVPAWARASLREHASDPREHIYSLAQLEQARTSDPIWNAAQRQLVREGTIHGYLRMLWGKRVLEWTRSPQEAHRILVELNNKYALDGRDPNSYSGIGWCFGLFDRAWGPERPIFGKVRYMNSDGARRKLQLARYLERFASKQSAASDNLPLPFS